MGAGGFPTYSLNKEAPWTSGKISIFSRKFVKNAISKFVVFFVVRWKVLNINANEALCV